MFVISFLIAVLPVILIGIYIYKKDTIKEPLWLLFKLFMGGVIACFPAFFIGIFLDNFFPDMEYMNFYQLFLYVFIVIALVEEVCKWLIVYRVSYNHRDFDSLYDMIVYASFVALGFACFENVLYVSEAGILTGLARAVTAVPGHVCDGIFMGLYLAFSKYYYVNGNIFLGKKYKRLSLIIPIITHGIYDFCLFLKSTLFIYIFLVYVAIIFAICFKKINQISRNNIKL